MTSIVQSFKLFIRNLFNIFWLSFTSVDFYKNVFSNYRGCGIKYILTLSLFSTAIFYIFLTFNLNEVKKGLEDDRDSLYALEINNILSQIPQINYNGQSISINSETPIYIVNKNNEKIIAFDPEQKILPSDRNKINLVLYKDNATLNLMFMDKLLSYPIYYKNVILGESSIDTQDIRNIALKFTKDLINGLKISLPFSAFFNFVEIFFKQIIIIAFIFIFAQIMGNNKIYISDCIRVAMFSAGGVTFFSFIDLLYKFNFITSSGVILFYNFIYWWPNILMVLAVSSQLRNYKQKI